MEDIAPEYDVVVLGTGRAPTYKHGDSAETDLDVLGLTECVLSGYTSIALANQCCVAD